MPIAKSREVVKIRIRAFLLIPVLTVMLLVVGLSCYWFFLKDPNAGVRITLLKVAIEFLTVYPLGSFGTWDFFSSFKSDFVAKAPLNEGMRNEVLANGPHNAFVNAFVLYGVQGFTLISLLIFSGFWRFLAHATNTESQSKQGNNRQLCWFYIGFAY